MVLMPNCGRATRIPTSTAYMPSGMKSSILYVAFFSIAVRTLSGGLLVASTVVPSGLLRATCSQATPPPAPGLLMITRVALSSDACRCSSMTRGAVSVGPPGGNGTTSSIGPPGQAVCAASRDAGSSNGALAAICRNVRRRIGSISVCSLRRHSGARRKARARNP
jgi:hypothetical protein